MSLFDIFNDSKFVCKKMGVFIWPRHGGNLTKLTWGKFDKADMGEI